MTNKDFKKLKDGLWLAANKLLDIQDLVTRKILKKGTAGEGVPVMDLRDYKCFYVVSF